MLPVGVFRAMPPLAWGILFLMFAGGAGIMALHSTARVPATILLYIVQPLYACLLAVGMWWVTRGKKDRLHRTREKATIVASVMVLWAVIYFLSGLLFTYGHNPLWGNIGQIVTNTILYIGFGCMVEYARHRFVLLIGRRHPTYYGLVVSIIFAWPYVLLSSGQFVGVDAGGVALVAGTLVVPLLLQSVTLTYLAYTAGLRSMLWYRSSTDALVVLLPILPHHDWYVVIMTSIILCVVLVSLLDYTRQDRSRTLRFRSRHRRWVGDSAFALLIVGLVLLMTGVLSYKPYAVISGSMEPVYKRGDMVIVEKRTPEIDIRQGDIIQYQRDGIYITHRIVAVTSQEGETVYTTKGDNNEDNDPWVVTDTQIHGIIRGHIPFVGYPTVMLHELIQ